MTKTQRNQQLADAFRRHTAKVTATKESARSYLIGLGIYSPDGQVAPEYGGPAARETPTE
jgi:hypothetical protein